MQHVYKTMKCMPALLVLVAQLPMMTNAHGCSCEHFGACVLQFWKENVEKFEEKDFQILRVLLKLLEASRETRTLAVGCHDLGMFITNHPHGRSIVTGTVKSSCSMLHVQALHTLS